MAAGDRRGDALRPPPRVRVGLDRVDRGGGDRERRQRVPEAPRKKRGHGAGVLGAIAIAPLLGVSYLAVQEHARPSGTASVVSQIARATFPDGSAVGFMYYAVQV